MRWISRAANLVHRRAAEREMRREIASNLALLQEEFERRGFAPEEATRLARRAMGGVERAKELHREARSFAWVEQFFRDLFYGARNLTRAPGFTILAVLALALGIGVNATIFGLYNAVVWKPLPVADPSRVFRLQRWFERGAHGAMQFQFAWPEYEHLHEHATSFAGLTASADVVALESRDGAPYGDPRVLGQSIELNGIAFTIVGVMPRKFRGTALAPVPTAFWTPLAMLERLDPSFKHGWREQWRDATHSGFELLARLNAGTSRAQAEAETSLLMRQFLAGRSESEHTTSVNLRRTSYRVNSSFSIDQEIRLLLAVLLALVLLVACANVANMLLARGMARRREIGIRLAMGASRGRVIRQLLAENFLLAAAGSGLGLLVSAWSARLLWVGITSILQGLMRSVTFDVDVNLDARVFLFGALLSVLTTLLFGLAPALASTRVEINAAIKPVHPRLRGLLLAAQVASVVVLLSLAGGLASSVRKSKVADLGFEAKNVYMAMFIYSSDAVDPKAVNRRLRERLGSVAGVDSVTIGDVPLWNGKQQTMADGSTKHRALVSYGSGAYFETLRLPILRGRSFTQAEAERNALVAIVSEFTARIFWPNQDPLGKRFSLAQDNQNFEIIGVARNVRFNDLTEPDEVHVYLPSIEKHSGRLFFRTRGDRKKALEAVRAEINSIDPQLLLALVLVSLEDGPFRVQRSFLQVLGTFSATLSALSLTLAAIGIYGVMAFLVSQRTKEIGIRMALGAGSCGVIRGVLARGFLPVLLGMAAGFAAAGALGVFLDHMDKEFPDPILQVFFADPAGYAEFALMLAVAALASIAPARRATRVDPVVALRHE